MKSKTVLRTLFSLLAVATVAAGVFLSQKNLKAGSDKSDTPGTSGFRYELLGMGGGRLGIQLEDVTAENMSRYRMTEETGAAIKSVEKDSSADKAGLQENDVIVAYAGTAVSSVGQLTRMVRETPPQRTVKLDLRRNGHRQTIPVKVGGRSNDFLELHSNAGKLAERAGMLDKGGAIKLFSGRGDFSERPRLGVSLESLTDQMATYFAVKDGVLITSVREDSPAAKAGLRAGDVITAIGDKEVAQPYEVIKRLFDKAEGGALTINIVRDKRPMTITVNLDKLEKSERTYSRKSRGTRNPARGRLIRI
ncbi:MAG: PDZ domain-containing protein [Acidobacteria bacterium]|nr:PDZ domain-containing protein [Acidobacteriota bacterium]MBI3658743.1 PDZ domain-containing protein [Acidobacteriota bacterium]